MTRQPKYWSKALKVLSRKDIVIKNKNKRKNINNYINNVFGGLINYLEQSDHFQLMNQKGKLLLTFKNDRPDFKEWIIVDDY